MNEVIHKRRHRIVLDVTFRHGHTYSGAVDELMSAISAMDMSEVEYVRPLDYRKVLTTAARLENEQIRADLETAMDAIREARNRCDDRRRDYG